MSQVYRKQYMMKVSPKNYVNGKLTDEFTKVLEQIEEISREHIRDGELTTLSLFNYKNVLFLYYEGAGEELDVEVCMGLAKPYLQAYPTLMGEEYFVLMNPYFYHSIPGDEQEWRRESCPENRVGRIALLKEDKYVSYVYHHLRIVREGLLLGDQYHLISMYDRILFSYFEEPKKVTNINKSEEPSKTIKDWIDVDPDNHFERFDEAQSGNFLVLPRLISL